MIAEETQLDLTGILVLCPDARVLSENGLAYVYLPSLVLPDGCKPEKADALLCMGACDGYASRLFFSERIASSKALNWHVNDRRLFDRTWHAYSWSNVAAAQPSIRVLAAHLDALR